MRLETHFKLLGLAPGSSLKLVKRAYLREIKIWHPDRYSPDSVLRSQAEERTKALTAAYTALTEALSGSDQAQSAPESRPRRSAEVEPQKKPGRATQSDAAPSIGHWVQRVWQRIGTLIKAGPASPQPASVSSATAKRGAGKQGVRKSRQPRFDEVLAAARKHPKKPADIALVWRRLAARRARYGRRGSGGASVSSIQPRGPVRPVDPVDRVHAIGKER